MRMARLCVRSMGFTSTDRGGELCGGEGETGGGWAVLVWVAVVIEVMVLVVVTLIVMVVVMVVVVAMAMVIVIVKGTKLIAIVTLSMVVMVAMLLAIEMTMIMAIDAMQQQQHRQHPLAIATWTGMDRS